MKLNERARVAPLDFTALESRTSESQANRAQMHVLHCAARNPGTYQRATGQVGPLDSRRRLRAPFRALVIGSAGQHGENGREHRAEDRDDMLIAATLGQVFQDDIAAAQVSESQVNRGRTSKVLRGDQTETRVSATYLNLAEHSREAK